MSTAKNRRRKLIDILPSKLKVLIGKSVDADRTVTNQNQTSDETFVLTQLGNLIKHLFHEKPLKCVSDFMATIEAVWKVLLNFSR